MLTALLGSLLSSNAAETALRVDGERQLFMDRLFFDQAERISLRLHPARKTGELVLRFDKPWESATLNWFSVMQDRGVVDRKARYRMWYECYDVPGWPTADDTSFCYAESRDGVHWTKPELHLFEYQGSTSNNILFRQVGSAEYRSRVYGSGVFLDPTAPPESRYKAVSQGLWQTATPPYRIAGMSSPDGLRWTRHSKPICDVFADSQYSCFWDPRLRRYVLYGRTAGNIGRAESPDFTSFPPLQLVLQADQQDPPNSNLYNPAALRYPGAANVYLLFPSLYQRDPKIDTLDIRLAVSRDGVHWTYPDQSQAFIPRGPAGAWDNGCLYLGQGLIQVGNELWLYYSGSPLRHQTSELEDLVKCPHPRAFSRVVVSRDRFVSAEAGPEGGWFVTPPLHYSGTKLRLNAKVRRGGRIRVALLDEVGTPRPGRGLDDAVPITGDHLDTVVRWKNGAAIGSRDAPPVRLHIELRDASLFAFQFATR